MDDWNHLGADADETHATQLARFAEDWGYRGAPRPGAAAEDRPRRQTRRRLNPPSTPSATTPRQTSAPVRDTAQCGADLLSGCSNYGCGV